MQGTEKEESEGEGGVDEGGVVAATSQHWSWMATLGYSRKEFKNTNLQ